MASKGEKVRKAKKAEKAPKIETPENGLGVAENQENSEPARKSRQELVAEQLMCPVCQTEFTSPQTAAMFAHFLRWMLGEQPEAKQHPEWAIIPVPIVSYGEQGTARGRGGPPPETSSTKPCRILWTGRPRRPGRRVTGATRGRLPNVSVSNATTGCAPLAATCTRRWRSPKTITLSRPKTLGVAGQMAFWRIPFEPLVCSKPRGTPEGCSAPTRAAWRPFAPFARRPWVTTSTLQSGWKTRLLGRRESSTNKWTTFWKARRP